MSTDLSIFELDKIFFGERTTQLTENEIYLLVNSEMSSVTFYYLTQGLLKKAFDVRIYLKAVVDKILSERTTCYDFTSKYELAMFGLAFRGLNRANPNIYFRKHGKGTMHIISYIFINFANMRNVGNIDRYIMMLLILIYVGSNISLQNFSDDGEKYDENNQSLFSIEKGITVREYLLTRNQVDLVKRLDIFKEDVNKYIHEKKSNPNIDTLKYSPIVKDNILEAIGMYLDSPVLIVSNYINTLDLIKYQDIRILESNKRNLTPQEQKDLLRYSILFNSPDTFNIIYKKFGEIDYVDVNILFINTAYNKRYRYLDLQMRKNILMLIDSGIMLDTYEVSLLQKIDPEFSSDVIKRYDKPRWRKECSLMEGEPSRELRELAYQLNIDPFNDKDFICSKIKDISNTDPKLLITAAINREKSKLSSKFSYINDYINGEPSYQCYNKELLTNNPFEYVDLDIASYKDTRGLIWCFTKESFDLLLKTKTNIYDNEALPEEFIASLEEQKKLLDRLGVYNDKSKTIADGLNKLDENDHVKTKDQVNKLLTKFENILLSNEINPINVRKMSPDKMNIMARSFEYPEVNFAVFPEEQRYVAFATTMFNKFKEDPNNIRRFVMKYSDLQD